MNILAKAILRRVFDRIDTTAELARLPAVYQNSGGGLMSRNAAAGILRLALRWPAFSVILILSVVAARVMSGRRHQPKRQHYAATQVCWLSTAVIFRQASILRNLLCPLRAPNPASGVTVTMRSRKV
jgi:hypothetical protein